jgi:hypothetical protein
VPPLAASSPLQQRPGDPVPTPRRSSSSSAVHRARAARVNSYSSTDALETWRSAVPKTELAPFTHPPSRTSGAVVRDRVLVEPDRVASKQQAARACSSHTGPRRKRARQRRIAAASR